MLLTHRALFCRAFVAHQQRREGVLMAASDLSPVDVVEDVAELLLDDLLLEQAEGGHRRAS